MRKFGNTLNGKTLLGCFYYWFTWHLRFNWQRVLAGYTGAVPGSTQHSSLTNSLPICLACLANFRTGIGIAEADTTTAMSIDVSSDSPFLAWISFKWTFSKFSFLERLWTRYHWHGSIAEVGCFTESTRASTIARGNSDNFLVVWNWISRKGFLFLIRLPQCETVRVSCLWGFPDSATFLYWPGPGCAFPIVPNNLLRH